MVLERLREAIATVFAGSDRRVATPDIALAAGYLVAFGLLVPFAVGAALEVSTLVVVYTQVFESLDRGYRIEERTAVQPRVRPRWI